MRITFRIEEAKSSRQSSLAVEAVERPFERWAEYCCTSTVRHLEYDETVPFCVSSIYQ